MKAAKILGVANPDPFNVCIKLVLPSAFLNLIFPLLDWKSSKLLHEDTSNHFSSPGAHTSRSKHFAAAKCFDLEVWAPGEEKWLEVSSCSNFEDFQSRRGNIRFKNADGSTNFIHTLNGSGLATPRIFAAFIETHQNEDGSIRIPSSLQPYMEISEIK